MFGMFKKKELKKTGELILRVWFSSGGYFDVHLKPEALEKITTHLENKWNTTTLSRDKFGINFALVSHYEVLNL